MLGHPNSSPLNGNADASSPKTLVSGAYLALRRDIIQGRLAPGSRLRVEHMKETYHVGAGTLREALGLLASDALVVIQGQRGFRVADMTFSDFKDITETRVTLECHALRQSIRCGGDEWEGSLTSAFHMLSLSEERLRDNEAGNFDDWEAANKRFHESLISRSDSPWTQHFLRILYSQAERYRRLLVVNRPVSRDVHKEHEAIFAAALARDEDAACQILASHIRYNLELYRSFAGKQED
jgi:GntR family transcriptional regulator, carbon starvation induced regulator